MLICTLLVASQVREIINNIANVVFVGPAPLRTDESEVDALLRLMFQKNPAARPTVRQVATHPYLEGFSLIQPFDDVSQVCL